MKKKTLSNKEKRELNEKIARFGYQFEKKDNVELVEEGDLKIIKSKEALFFYSDEEILPTLKNLLMNDITIKKITVDMGAVKFVVNGADIMRPGIVEIEEGIESGEVIAVIDVNNKKPLSIGRACLNSEDMGNEEKGKVVKNIHYIGDEIWNS